MKSLAGIGQTLFSIVMYLIGACLIGLALAPVAYTLLWAWPLMAHWSLIHKSIAFSLLLGLGYFVFGFMLALETVGLRYVLGLKLKEGEHSLFSLAAAKWAFTNATMLIVNLLFMDFMRLTPFLPLYYSLMGAKIGKGVQINTKGIADVSLVEIGDDSVIGGDAVIIGHIVEHGKLKLKRTVIGKKVTIGLGAVVMPGCIIGDKSLVAARSVLSKNTQVQDGSIFAGTPAKFIKTVGS